MKRTRKKQIAALFTAFALLSGMAVTGTLNVSAEEINEINVSAPNDGETESGLPINISTLSAPAITHGQSVKVWLSSKNIENVSCSYDVYFKKETSSTWSAVPKEKVENAEFVTLKPSKAANYEIRVDATYSSNNFSNDIVERIELPLQVVKPINNTSYLSSGSVSYGDSAKIYFRSEGGIGKAVYAVYYKKSSETEWKRYNNYSSSENVLFTPKTAEPYDFKIKAKDENGNVSNNELTLLVRKDTDLMNKTELSSDSIILGEKVTIKNASSGGKDSVQFAAYSKYTISGEWKRISNYTDAENIQFTPAKSGEYVIRTKVMDTSGRVINKDISLTVTKINDTENEQMIYNLEDYAAIQREVDPDYTLPVNLPSRINNAKSEYFPSIINQGDSNICLPCSMAYYMYTYEYNRLHGITTNEMNSFSPIFTYNQEEDENLGGTWIEGVYSHLKNTGVADKAHAPFGEEVISELIGNLESEEKIKEKLTPYYRDLPLDEDVYRYAADHRIQYYYRYSKFGESEDSVISSVNDPDIMPIKAALADGHVLSVTVPGIFEIEGTNNVSGWATRALKPNPDSDNPEINKDVGGQSCISYCFGNRSIWHAMTIVGYDDNIWTDINGNGKIDQGEMGALKLANSWGENFDKHVEGCYWMAYDALNKESCVDSFHLKKVDNEIATRDSNYKRQKGLDNVTGIQLMPADYKPSVFMHYVANTNDRVNSYTYLTGEYNGKTITECIDPYAHNTGDKKPVPYNLSNPGRNAHFVYDISTMLRKLEATDYTKVKWTVKFESGDGDDVDIAWTISDVYLCDEKNYRIYRTNGTFPILLNTGDVEVLSLSDTYTRYAKVNYRGYSGDVELKYYPQGDNEYNYLNELMMSRASTDEGYTHTAIIELGEYEYYNVYFHDYKSDAYDENGGADYKIYPGENYFETTEAIKPLTITLNNESGTKYSTGNSPELSASAQGGVGSYRFRYTVRDMRTNALVFDGIYGYLTDTAKVTDIRYAGKTNAFVFENAGEYQITVYACDITGNTVHQSFNVTVSDRVPE